MHTLACLYRVQCTDWYAQPTYLVHRLPNAKSTILDSPSELLNTDMLKQTGFGTALQHADPQQANGISSWRYTAAKISKHGRYLFAHLFCVPPLCPLSRPSSSLSLSFIVCRLQPAPGMGSASSIGTPLLSPNATLDQKVAPGVANEGDAADGRNGGWLTKQMAAFLTKLSNFFEKVQDVNCSDLDLCEFNNQTVREMWTALSRSLAKR